MRTTPKVLLLAAIMAQAAIGCASIQVLHIDRSKVTPVSTLTSNSAGQQDFVNAVQAGKDVVVFIQKGQSVPLRIGLALPMARLEPAKNSLVFTRDTYLLISKSRVMISPDGERCARIGDFAALRKLYDAHHKELSIGFGVNKQDGAIISLGVASD